jgi:hypothetical protein
MPLLEVPSLGRGEELLGLVVATGRGGAVGLEVRWTD